MPASRTIGRRLSSLLDLEKRCQKCSRRPKQRGLLHRYVSYSSRRIRPDGAAGAKQSARLRGWINPGRSNSETSVSFRVAPIQSGYLRRTQRRERRSFYCQDFRFVPENCNKFSD
jgi:hypothetical protein